MTALAGVDVETRQVERCAEALGRDIADDERSVTEQAAAAPAPTMYLGLDGSGVPVRPAEVEGRRGKQPDGSAKTREVKLATMWTAETRDKAGRPVRDRGSVSYNAAVESAASRVRSAADLKARDGIVSGQRLIGAHLPTTHPERRETRPGRCSGCLTRFVVDVRLPLSGLRRLCGLRGGCRAGGAPPAVRGSAAAEAQPGRPARGVRPGDLDGAGQAVMPAVRRDADLDGGRRRSGTAIPCRTCRSSKATRRK